MPPDTTLLRSDRIRGHQVGAVHAGFSLIELMIVVAVVMLLMGILLVATQSIRRAVQRATAAATVIQLSNSCMVYQGEDPNHRFPPPDAGNTVRTHIPANGPPGVLDLLEAIGFRFDSSHIDRSSAVYLGALSDPWQRPYMYVVDQNMDGIADRPAPLLNWNPRAREPFAYLYSTGMNGPLGLPQTWIYLQETP